MVRVVKLAESVVVVAVGLRCFIELFYLFAFLVKLQLKTLRPDPTKKLRYLTQKMGAV